MKEEETLLGPIIDKSLIDDNVRQFGNIQRRLLKVYAQKNHDYGNSFNEGCNELGEGYAFSRIYEKTKRFQTLAKGIMTNNLSMQVQDETIDDTLMDLANYCVMYLAWKNNTLVPIENDYISDDNKHTSSTGELYIPLKDSIKNDKVIFHREGLERDYTKEIITVYGTNLYADNDNYVYVQHNDDKYTPVTLYKDNIMVKFKSN